MASSVDIIIAKEFAIELLSLSQFSQTKYSIVSTFVLRKQRPIFIPNPATTSLERAIQILRANSRQRSAVKIDELRQKERL